MLKLDDRKNSQINFDMGMFIGVLRCVFFAQHSGSIWELHRPLALPWEKKKDVVWMAACVHPNGLTDAASWTVRS